MSRGKHSRHILGGGRPVALVVVAALVFAAGGAAFALYRYDRASASRILPGVTVAGVDVGGLTRDEAIAAVTARADLSLSSDLVASARGETWHLTPAGLGMRANVAGAVDQAFAVADSMSIFSRVFDRITDRPVDRSIDLGYTYEQARIKAFVQQVADSVAEPPMDAGIELVDGQVVKHHARQGRELRADLASARIRSALVSHRSSVTLPVRLVQPAIPDAKLGQTIVVDLSQNRLYLFDAFKIEKTYPVATAMPGFTTPVGTWSIVNKVENPTWINPAPDGWGAGEPAQIPPGPGNPLGTRALYLSAPGIRIHGTYSTSSVGTYASHGCIRMYIGDSEELYPLVPIGTKVIIAP